MKKSEHKTKLINRMKRLIGHAQSNLRMVEEDKYCVDVIQQNLAVIAALHKANEAILEKHLNTCVKDAMQSGNTKRQNEVVQEITTIYKKLS